MLYAKRNTEPMGNDDQVPCNIINYLKLVLDKMSAIKNRLSATTHLVLFQINNTHHMINKAFYLL